MPHARRTPLVFIALLGLTLAGCEKGVKVGSWQVIQPKHPLVATSFQLTRRQGSPPAVKPVSATGAATQMSDELSGDGSQKLVVDLGTGHATFTDTDGRPYPTQIEDARLEELQTIIAGRSWQIGERGPGKAAANPVWYGLTVYNGEQAEKEQAFWSRPVENEKKHPLAAGLGTLEDTFEHAARVAHPISDTVDLLK